MIIFNKQWIYAGLLIIFSNQAFAATDCYLSSFSVAAGEEITLHVSSSESEVDVSIRDIRQQPTTIATYNGVSVSQQPIPIDSFVSSLNWDESLNINTTAWQSGIYSYTALNSSGSCKGGLPSHQEIQVVYQKYYF